MGSTQESKREALRPKEALSSWSVAFWHVLTDHLHVQPCVCSSPQAITLDTCRSWWLSCRWPCSACAIPTRRWRGWVVALACRAQRPSPSAGRRRATTGNLATLTLQRLAKPTCQARQQRTGSWTPFSRRVLLKRHGGYVAVQPRWPASSKRGSTLC